MAAAKKPAESERHAASQGPRANAAPRASQESQLSEVAQVSDELHESTAPRMPEVSRAMLTDADARTRLLEAALELFGSRGFSAVGVRELAAAAGVNVAAVNYHFGSKDELRMEALRYGFSPTLRVGEKMRAQLAIARTGGTTADAEHALRQCIDIFVRELVGANTNHWAMFLREQISSGPALEMVVREFFRPVGGVLAQLVEILVPGLEPMERHRVIASMVAQCLHVRNGEPVQRLFSGVDGLVPEYLKAAAEHIAHFSLLAMRGMRIERMEQTGQMAKIAKIAKKTRTSLAQQTTRPTATERAGSKSVKARR